MDVVHVIAALNTLMAFASFVVLQWSATKIGRPLNIVFVLASALALFYVGAYSWLLFHTGSGEAWSEFMRWISLVAWPIVWMGPAIASVVTRTRRNDMITDAASQIDVKKK